MPNLSSSDQSHLILGRLKPRFPASQNQRFTAAANKGILGKPLAASWHEGQGNFPIATPSRLMRRTHIHISVISKTDQGISYLRNPMSRCEQDRVSGDATRLVRRLSYQLRNF